MSIDLLAPADALAALLAPSNTPIGTIGQVTSRTVDPPYEGPTPLVMIRPLPVRGQIVREAARGYRVDGTLDLWYLDAVASEQDRALSAIEGDAGTNLALILAALLDNPRLSGTVIALGSPIQYLGDDQGPYVQVGDRAWFYLALRIPLIGIGGDIICV